MNSKAYVGATVHWVSNKQTNKKHLAAIVTAVFGDYEVQLIVFTPEASGAMMILKAKYDGRTTPDPETWHWAQPE